MMFKNVKVVPYWNILLLGAANAINIYFVFLMFIDLLTVFEYQKGNSFSDIGKNINMYLWFHNFTEMWPTKRKRKGEETMEQKGGHETKFIDTCIGSI